jgi:signal transduction histidine kinase/FixJ family two-component response regulator
MNTPLSVLIVEDSPDDALMLVRELRRGGYEVVHDTVQTAEAFVQALERHNWRIIISDYSMPRFNGLEALKLLNEHRDDIPFILISGTVGEEIAVESLKAGASDYLMKSNLLRLVPSVKRALREAEDRQMRHLAEAALRESQSLLSLVYNCTSDSLWLFRLHADNAWRLVSVNRTAVQKSREWGFRIDASAMNGKTVENVLQQALPAGQEVLANLYEHLREAAESGRISSVEERLLPAQGPIDLDFTIVPVTSEDSGVRHLLLAARDVSERKRAEAEQKKLQAQLTNSQKLEALGRLAGGIAHDFNNILTGVLGYTELIRHESNGNPVVRDCTDQIMRASERARDLVRQILTFSRRRSPAKHWLDLQPVVKEAVDVLRPVLPANIAVEMQFPEHCPRVFADSGQIHQVVLNLCKNAIHAMVPDDGRLTLRVEAAMVDAPFARGHPPLREGLHVRLCVADTGKGMDNTTLERIFEPFFTTKPFGMGTGLGLAVVHGIVQSHEAALAVYSHKGNGTEFQIYFPARHVESLPSQALAPAAASATSAVLLLDDDATVVQVAVSMMQKLGYQPHAFTDADEALACFRSDPAAFGVVVTDYAMPRMSGVDFARKIRAIRSDTPLVLTSGISDSLDMTKLKIEGFCEFLPKPFVTDKLAETLLHAFRREDD